MVPSNEKAERLKGMAENLHEFLVNREKVHRIVRHNLDALGRARARILSDDISDELRWTRWRQHVNQFRDTVVVPRFGDTLQQQLHVAIFEIVEAELRELSDLERMVHRSLSSP